MDLRLKGKVAMVAAASHGLGFAIAKELAAEGAAVSISSREAGAVREAARCIEQETGGAALGATADVRSREDIERWRDATVERFGAVDLLVTNTGGPPPGSVASLEDQAWQGAFELLVLSVVRMVRTVLPTMIARKSGNILLLTSSSVKAPIANLALSNVLRPSVAAFAKNLADELAPHGIRVNQLVPGRIATDRTLQLDEINAKRLGLTVEEQRKRAAAAIPMGRYGDPQEFARAAAFLLSDAASYITGATLQVDGGLIRTIS